MSSCREYDAGYPLEEVRAGIRDVKAVKGRHRGILGGVDVSENNPCRISVVSVLDNLLKGAATQAVQNLNLAFGLDAMTGLKSRTGKQV